MDDTFYEYKDFFLNIGVQLGPHPMLYGDILRKLSKVCDQDYLNSNELCKSLKAMECFFKYLATNSTINSQTKLPGKTEFPSSFSVSFFFVFFFFANNT